MPQLDPTSFPSQLFWLAVTFLALYALLARVFVPRIQEVLESRAHKIARDLDVAAQYQTEAGDAKDAYEKALHDARVKSQALLAETQAALAADAARERKALDGDLSAKLAAAEQSIASAKTRALEALTPSSEELTALIVEKLVQKKPKPEIITAVIGKVVKAKTW